MTYNSSFQDRAGQSAEARKKALEQYRARPPVDEKAAAERIAAGQAKHAAKAEKAAEHKGARCGEQPHVAMPGCIVERLLELMSKCDLPGAAHSGRRGGDPGRDPGELTRSTSRIQFVTNALTAWPPQVGAVAERERAEPALRPFVGSERVAVV
jgi:uncharacterized protein DUF6481